MKTVSLKTAQVQLLVLAITAMVAQPLFANAINIIQFTEISSSVLDVTYNGLSTGITVTFLSANNWQVDFPAQVTFDSTTQGWVEPELNGTANVVADSAVDHEVFVSSDAFFAGTPLADNTPVQIGTDTGNNRAIFAQFHDVGDGVAGVPETGSSIGLLFFAITGLLGANRLVSISLKRAEV